MSATRQERTTTSGVTISLLGVLFFVVYDNDPCGTVLTVELPLE